VIYDILVNFDSPNPAKSLAFFILATKSILEEEGWGVNGDLVPKGCEQHVGFALIKVIGQTPVTISWSSSLTQPLLDTEQNCPFFFL
jgi:hypothetical protein